MFQVSSKRWICPTSSIFSAVYRYVLIKSWLFFYQWAAQILVTHTNRLHISSCNWKWQGTLSLSWHRLRFQLIHVCVEVMMLEAFSHKAWLVQSNHSGLFQLCWSNSNGTMSRPGFLVPLNHIELSGVRFWVHLIFSLFIKQFAVALSLFLIDGIGDEY